MKNNANIQVPDNEELQSKVISFLRFPLIVGVVLIHTQIDTINGVVGNLSVPHSFNGVYPFYESTLYLFAQILSRVAVPLFFLFSGFLFFYKTNEFTAKTYVVKLKKRVHTLLIPYLFWNILFVIIHYVCNKLFPYAVDSFIGEGYSIKDWLMIFWNSNNTNCPVSYQFWFIRDLMVVILFTPIIYLLTKRLDYILPLFLGILWLMGWRFDITGLNIDAFFFFTLGAYFSITKKNLVEMVKSHVMFLGISYLILVVITFCFKNYEWVLYAKHVSILMGVAFAIALSAVNIANGKWTVNNFLTESSFFIYVYHIIALPVVCRILFFMIPCTTEARAIVLYFLWTTMVIVLGLVFYYFLKKWFPRTMNFVTGGR